MEMEYILQNIHFLFTFILHFVKTYTFLRLSVLFLFCIHYTYLFIDIPDKMV